MTSATLKASETFKSSDDPPKGPGNGCGLDAPPETLPLPPAIHGKTIFLLYEHTAQMMPQVERTLKEALANRKFSSLNVFHEMSGGSLELRESISRTVNRLLAAAESAWQTFCRKLENSPDLDDLRQIIRLVGILRRIGADHGTGISFHMLDMSADDPRRETVDSEGGIGAFTRMACSRQRDLKDVAAGAGQDLASSILARTREAITSGAAGIAVRNDAMADQLREQVPLTPTFTLNLVMVGAQHAPVRRALADRETFICAIHEGLLEYLPPHSSLAYAPRIYDRAEATAVAGRSITDATLMDCCLELGLWQTLNTEIPGLETRFLDPGDAGLGDSGSVRTVAAAVLLALDRTRRAELFRSAIDRLEGGTEDATFLQAMRQVWRDELKSLVSSGCLPHRLRELLTSSAEAGTRLSDSARDAGLDAR